MNLKRCFTLLLFVQLFMGSMFACSALQKGHRDVIEKSFEVEQGGTLTVDSDRGSIAITSNTGNRVEVEIIRTAHVGNKKRAEEMFDNFVLKFAHQGRDVTIHGENTVKRSSESWFGRKRRLSLKYIISVPKHYNLDLKTSGGSISAEDLEGDVLCRTSGGSLKFGDITGQIEGKTSGGSITLGNVDGEVDVHTSGGSIRISRAKGSVIAKTSGGSISVDEVFGDIQARTSGGSITARLREQPKADCRLTTSGGSVNVYLNEDTNARIDAKTSGGRVRTSLPITVSGTIGKRSLKGTLNEGGPELYLRTSGGSINIKEN